MGPGRRWVLGADGSWAPMGPGRDQAPMSPGRRWVPGADGSQAAMSLGADGSRAPMSWLPMSLGADESMAAGRQVSIP